MTTLEDLTLEELRNLGITQVEFCDLQTLCFTLSNGQTCKAGTHGFQKRHNFDPSKKITKVVMIIGQMEQDIIQIKFYSYAETLVKLGRYDDEEMEWYGERVEVFEICEDEKLIGCKLDEGKLFDGLNFYGVTWIKMQIPKMKI